jgi:hypothetical protein
MKRLGGLLVSLGAGLSLLLLVLVCAMWVRSYWRADVAGQVGDSGMFCVGSYRGHLLWAVNMHPQREPEGPEWAHDSYDLAVAENTWDAIRNDASWRVAGFSYSREHQPDMQILVTPSWAVALATAGLPILCVRSRSMRRRRSRMGLCAQCGYDLRASPERCPECGLEVLIPSP